MLFGLILVGFTSSSWPAGLIIDTSVTWHFVATWLLRVIPLNHVCVYALRCVIIVLSFLCLSCSFPSPRACFFEWIVGNPIWFVSRLSCKLILGACIFFRHQRKLWLSSAARLLWVTPLDHACLLTFLFFSCYLSVSGSCLQSRAASRHRYVQKKT